ncbi:protein WHAT'S THIS FACTOR 1, chloroplastic [Manihot esculenta]|uniref:PORR domain-containing protein n=6 Tax=Manihot esculenta TaxID=3983 RepID=A0A251LKC5_MANES|nr:protein WHAT'S THIS FACTOR 1, chloroplastic [Manihot esculenta]XP_021604447.1 protein WHAT'S THIS FACTOR 1, chloroplastic [Manihot esculenta]XP_021604448.1 protein WHAT'S THIS FACTOR 1, chloroplastic [Manihot esculenta]XP_021604450.1 protein WHAT'S THIS FACTOR 1, chloroplastic [Manihot esculenta]XP_021604451.1 protein WHAT'S THIS FACTOR 1, chloroplastic [Manihot esculenta]XP_021604452.1 protein WHAT'S THIS FACTOR 1, chloroplastic [Manihot esculenta]XP_021604453.1 protein WHAT'S THIS FACTOR
MTRSLSLPLQNHCYFSKSIFLPSTPLKRPRNHLLTSKKPVSISLSMCCSSPKMVRDASLDKHVVRQNKIRFVQKLKTLLLSKPKHYIPLHILSKCRSYLSLPDRRSIRSMIHRYPSIFEVFTIPTPQLPFNATKPYSQLCVRLTSSAVVLADQEFKLHSAISDNLAAKLQKLLMLSSHRRLLLSKLVHLAPDLGLPPNFRSRLCNDHPDKFKTVDTSYGRALELVSWDAQLAVPLSRPDVSLGLIVDRPLKFKHLRLRKGLNLKRRHQDFLIKFEELPDVCPYNTSSEEFVKETIEAEKRACAVVREVLGMTVEKRTLIDHLTHFRKEFGFPNKLRGMIVRHPELFYVSVKGLRDSVFLTEGYDDKGRLLKNDETSALKDQLMGLVRESKRMRREKRIGDTVNGSDIRDSDDVSSDESDDIGDDYFDGLENVFDSECSGFDCDLNKVHKSYDLGDYREKGEFWTVDACTGGANKEGRFLEPW